MEDKDGDSSSKAPVAVSKRRQRNNIRKRPAPESFDGDEEGEGGAVAHRPKQQKSFEFSTRKDEKKDEMFALRGSRTFQQVGDQGATRMLETETEYDKDARCAMLNYRQSHLVGTWDS